MVTLYIMRDCPYPPASGTLLRGWQNINILAKRGHVHLFSIGYRAPGTTAVPLVASWTHIDSETSEAKASIGSWVQRVARSRQFPLEDAAMTATLNVRITRMIDEIEPDLIVLSHWHNAVPDALKGRQNLVVDAHNVESVLGTGVRAADGTISGFIRGLKLWRWRRRERDLFRAAARIWVPSRTDADMIARLDPDIPTPVIWPNTLDLEYYRVVRDVKAASARTRSRPTVIFVGLFAYKPNAKAALILMDEILPLLATSIPNVQLLLVGADPTSEMIERAKHDERIHVTGRVPDVRPYLARAQVSVVPLTEGGGTRVKILECFAAGVAVVASRKAIEGIEAAHATEAFTDDEPATMARHAIDLLRNGQQRTEMAERAFDLVRRSYSWGSLDSRLDAALPETIT